MDPELLEAAIIDRYEKTGKYPKAIVPVALYGMLSIGVLHDSVDPHTDCEPNANVEALRVYLDAAGIEARPLWKPMHKQPVYCEGASVVAGSDLGYTVLDGPKMTAYTNDVEVDLFKIGMCLPSGPCVTDDVAYIVESIKEAIK